mgnify:CR=1 FL=1
MATAKTRLGLALRIIGWTLGSIVMLVLVAATSLLFVGRSDWGRRQILQVAMPLVQKALLGEVRIGGLDGDLVHMLVLRDVSLRDPEGQLVARVSRVGLRYNLFALLHHTLHITAVDAQGEVHARYLRDGRLNFAALTKATPPSNQPLPITILVSGINADLTAFTHEPPAPVASPIPVLEVALHVEGGVRMERDHSLEAELKELSTQAIAPAAAALHVKGQVELKGAGVALKGIRLNARTTGEQINRLAPSADLHGSVAVAAQLEGTLDQLQAVLDVTLPKGDVHAEAKVQPQKDPLSWEALLRLRGVDPAALRAAVPSCTIDLDATAQGSGASGRLQLQKLQVAAADNQVALSGTVEVPPELLDTMDWLALKADLKLDVKAPHLDQLARLGAPRLSGSLQGSIATHLGERSLRLNTALAGDKLQGFGAAVDHLSLNVDTVDLSGQVKLAVQELRVAQQRFAQLELGVRGSRELLHLKASGHGPEQVAFRLAVSARPELPKGAPATGSLALRGLDVDLTELWLARQGKQLAIVRPARVLLNLHDAPIIDVEHLTLALGGQSATLAGHYETRGQAVRAQLQTRGLDVRQLAKVFDPRSDLPSTRLDLQARVGGSVSAPIGKVMLNAAVNPSQSVPVPASNVVATVDLNAQKVSGELSVKPQLKGSAQPGQAEATGGQRPADGPRLQVRFAGPISGRGPIRLDATAQATLQSLNSLLPKDARSLRGALNLQVVVSGTTARPELALRASMPAWQSTWGGGKNTALSVDYKGAQLMAQLGSQLVTTDEKPMGGVQLAAQTPLMLSTGVTGAQLMRQLQTAASTADLSLVALDIPRVWKSAMQKDAPLRAGIVDAHLKVTGPVLSESVPPTVMLKVDARNLDYAENKNLPPVKGEAGLQLDYKDAQALLDLNAAVNGKPLLKGHAAAKLRPTELINGGSKSLQQLPLAAKVEILPQELPANLPVRGQLSAQVRVSGTVSAPQILADVTSNQLRIQEWTVGNINAHASFDKSHGIKADVAIAAAPGQPGDIKLAAFVPLPLNLESPDLRVELHAHGYRIDYKPASQNPDALSTGGSGLRLARGLVEADLEVHGAKPQPVGSGFLKLSGGEFSASAVPQVFKDIVVDLQVEKTGRFTLRKVAASAEGGKLNASGSAQLDGMVLRTASLKVNASRFPVSAGPIGLWLDTDIDISGETKGGTLRGKVKVAKTTVTLPKLESGRSVQAIGPLEDVRLVDAAARRAAVAQAKEEQKKEAKQAKAAQQPNKDAGGLPSRTLIAVELPDPIRVIGPEIKTSLMGHIDVEMNAPKNTPIIKGEIHSLSGWVQLLKHHYQLSRAQVSLSGESPPNPIIDVQISSQMQDAMIYIGASGTAQKPRVRFSSDPPIYDESQVIALVLAGGRQGGGGMEQRVIGGLSSLLIDQLQEQLAGGLPIDVIRFDLGSNDPMSTNRTSLEVGKYIRDDLFLLYTHRFGSSLNTLHRSNNDEVTLEWHFFRNYQVDLMGGDQGMGALNLYWLKRF